MISDHNALYSVQLPLLIHGAHRANQYAQEVMQKFQQWSKKYKKNLVAVIKLLMFETNLSSEVPFWMDRPEYLRHKTYYYWQ